MRQLVFLTTLLLMSCGHSAKEEVKTATTPEQTGTQADNKVDNALAFLNGYVDNCNKMKQSVDMVSWVDSSKLATNNFKTELKRIMDEAYKNEPEVGLDFDPILDAQDYPDKGFEIESFDEKANYLIARGKDWPDFKLTMKIIKENGDWLVDGCGIVNIPDEKRFVK